MAKITVQKIRGRVGIVFPSNKFRQKKLRGGEIINVEARPRGLHLSKDSNVFSKNGTFKSKGSAFKRSGYHLKKKRNVRHRKPLPGYSIAVENIDGKTFLPILKAVRELVKPGLLMVGKYIELIEASSGYDLVQDDMEHAVPVPSKRERLMKIVDQIMEEDDNLLRRLAQ